MTIGSLFIEPNLIWMGLALLVMLSGLFLLVIPILPGLVIIWSAALGYGLLAGYSKLGWVMFALLTVFWIAGELSEHILMGTLAHKEGAPWWVVLIVLVVAIVGNLIFPILGGLVAGVLVLFGIEWLRVKDAKKAWDSTRGMLVGFAWGFVIRFVTGLLMIALWCIGVFA